MPPFPNHYILKKVAEKDAKCCWICYKFSTNVLVSLNNKDWFYICPSHVNDKKFCLPHEATAAAAKERAEKLRKEEIEREKVKIIKEYEERRKRREERRKALKAGGRKAKAGGDDAKKSKEEVDEEEKKDTEGKDKKIKELEEEKKHDKVQNEKTLNVTDELAPTVVQLAKLFYTQRTLLVAETRQAQAKQETLLNPLAFPSVPKSDPGIKK